MDPDTAYSILISPPTMWSLDDRIANGSQLIDWLAAGGFPPAALVRRLADIAPYGASSPARSREWVDAFVYSLQLQRMDSHHATS